MELRPLFSAENSPASLMGRRAIRLYGGNSNGGYETALRNGSMDTVFTETVTDMATDQRHRNAGNQPLQCLPADVLAATE